LLDANLDAVVIIGPNARIEDVNTALETITGRPRPELIGSDAALYLTDREAARRLYRDAIRNGSLRDRPLEVRHRDGHVTHVLCSASAYRDSDGRIMGVVAAARPISAAVAESAPVGADQPLRRTARLVVALVSLLSMLLGAAGLALASPSRSAAWHPLDLPSAPLAASFILAGLACGLLGTQVANKCRAVLAPAARLMASGLGAMLSCLRQLSQKGGDLKLCGLSRPVRAAFELVRLHRVLDIHATRAQAIGAFQS
jgi:PAS domain S-box-containing protein